MLKCRQMCIKDAGDAELELLVTVCSVQWWVLQVMDAECSWHPV